MKRININIKKLILEAYGEVEAERVTQVHVKGEPTGKSYKGLSIATDQHYINHQGLTVAHGRVLARRPQY